MRIQIMFLLLVPSLFAGVSSAHSGCETPAPYKATVTLWQGGLFSRHKVITFYAKKFRLEEVADPEQDVEIESVTLAGVYGEYKDGHYVMYFASRATAQVKEEGAGLYKKIEIKNACDEVVFSQSK